MNTKEYHTLVREILKGASVVLEETGKGFSISSIIAGKHVKIQIEKQESIGVDLFCFESLPVACIIVDDTIVKDEPIKNEQAKAVANFARDWKRRNNAKRVLDGNNFIDDILMGSVEAHKS